MTPQERSELASLHALSLLEGAEAAHAAHLEATDADFAKEVAEFSESVSILADAIPPMKPSDLFRERVLSLAGSRKPRPVWIPWAAAAILAISAGSLLLDRAGQKQAIVSLKQQSIQLRHELEQARSDNSMAGLRIASLEGQLDNFKGTRAVVVWDPTRREGRINLSNLPATEPGKAYQLWIVDPDQKNPVSGGMIERAENGTANVPFQPAQMMNQAAAFAISIEDTGGVDVARGPIVLIGK